MYIYIYMYVCVYIYIYITYIESACTDMGSDVLREARHITQSIKIYYNR